MLHLNYRSAGCTEECRREIQLLIASVKSILVHQIHAPIVSIQGLLILLLSETCTEEDRKRMLEHLLKTIETVNRHTVVLTADLTNIEHTIQEGKK